MGQSGFWRGWNEFHSGLYIDQIDKTPHRVKSAPKAIELNCHFGPETGL